MIKLEGIQKYFPSNGVQALDNASFELKLGEIHALLGENGAGKSTLMHVMAGYLQPDSGSIVVDNKPRTFTIPRNAIKSGIGMVRQDPRMVPGFRVWEDCTVGLQSRFGIISRSKSRALVKSVSEEWGFDLPVDDSVEHLTIGQRQKAAILSLLLKDINYFILDEPTAVLSIVETERLFYLLKKLRNKGKGIVIISHKLEETLALSDRVTVLRNGRLITSRMSKDVSIHDLTSSIFGSEKTTQTELMFPTEEKSINISSGNFAQNKIILQVDNLFAEDPEKPFLRGIDLSITSGKIIGFAGVKDSGTETLELALAGFIVPQKGHVILDDTSIGGQGVNAFRKAGGAYLSGDRTGTAMAYDLPLYDSLIIHAHKRSGENKNYLRENFGLIDKDYLLRWANRIMEKAGVPRSVKSSGSAFSGGMIQRIVLQRELTEDAKLFILSEPIWGLDRHAAEKVINELKDYAAHGKSILIFSADLDFLISVSDEIIALKNGFVSASFKSADYPEKRKLKDAIGQAMIGSPRYHKAGFPL
ncbi:MAG: ATP-binding cassette domain-containing protein [Treponema sp.]|jgi:simple sugar transport system ATP-binding protein|nr:ATP-binding cassette domain-containing protein [Treponema sp.]